MKYRQDALKFLKDSGEGLANGHNNDEAISLVSKLTDLGCLIQVELEETNDEENEFDAYRFDAELFVKLPRKEANSESLIELLITIVQARPDEISEDENNVIRLWWD